MRKGAPKGRAFSLYSTLPFQSDTSAKLRRRPENPNSHPLSLSIFSSSHFPPSTDHLRSPASRPPARGAPSRSPRRGPSGPRRSRARRPRRRSERKRDFSGPVPRLGGERESFRFVFRRGFLQQEGGVLFFSLSSFDLSLFVLTRQNDLRYVSALFIKKEKRKGREEREARGERERERERGRVVNFHLQHFQRRGDAKLATRPRFAPQYPPLNPPNQSRDTLKNLVHSRSVHKQQRERQRALLEGSISGKEKTRMSTQRN